MASQPLPTPTPPAPVVGACENGIGGGNDSTLHLSLPNSRHRYKVVELVLVIPDLFGLIESLWLEMKSERKKKKQFPLPACIKIIIAFFFFTKSEGEGNKKKFFIKLLGGEYQMDAKHTCSLFLWINSIIFDSRQGDEGSYSFDSFLK